MCRHTIPIAGPIVATDSQVVLMLLLFTRTFFAQYINYIITRIAFQSLLLTDLHSAVVKVSCWAVVAFVMPTLLLSSYREFVML